MSSKNLFIYNSNKLFEILNEIKEKFNFEISYIEKKDLKKKDFDEYSNYLIITTEIKENIDNCLILDDLPKKIDEIVEKINLSFLKKQFSNQSQIKIGKYILNLNSRKINFNNINQGFTERECNLILFIKSQQRANLEDIQKNVWNYRSNLETHTVETHIYRIRKKMIDSFDDNDFIKFDKKGYFLNNK